MASVNKVILVGRLTRDPEMKYTPSGAAVTTFGLATDKFSKGEKSADFHNIVCWDSSAERGRKLATNAAEYLAKGSQVYIEGRLQTREWEGSDGVKRRSTEVVAFEVQFLDKKREGSGKAAEKPAAADDVDPDDVPF